MLTLVQDLPRKEERLLPVGLSGRSFDELRDLGRQAAESGELAESLAYLDEALEIASSAGDPQLTDLAVCNRSAVLLMLGRHRETAPQLRQILMNNRCVENSFLAALNLSRVYVRDKAPKKGLFYAQIARDRALGLGSEKWLVYGYNQLANCLVDESRFIEAVEEYRRALSLMSPDPSVLRASVLANLGYCYMLTEGVRAGFPLTFRALRWFRKFGARVFEVWPQLDLCYGYIEVGRFDRAREHGLEALALAEESGDMDRVKNALYLLGDAEREAGRLESAYDYFCQLQERFYPESPQITELMVAVNMRQVVNLRA